MTDTSNDALLPCLIPLQVAVQDAARWFGEYAAGHSAAGKSDKAERNQQRAQAMRDALAASNAALRQPDDRLREVREALERNIKGWETVVEFGLLLKQHHATARALVVDTLAALAKLDAASPKRTATYAPAKLEYAAVDQNDLWLLRFADQDCGDQWFGGDGWTAEEARNEAIEAWNRYAPAWSVRLMRTVTLDEVRAASPEQPQ